MFLRNDIYKILAKKNEIENNLKEKQKLILTDLQQQITKNEKEDQKLEQEIELNRTQIHRHIDDLKIQYQLIHKEEPRMDELSQWASHSEIDIVKEYYDGFKLLKKKNQHLEKIRKEINSELFHLSVQLASKQIAPPLPPLELNTLNDTLSSIYAKEWLPVNKLNNANSIVNVTKGTIDAIKKERMIRTSASRALDSTPETETKEVVGYKPKG